MRRKILLTTILALSAGPNQVLAQDVFALENLRGKNERLPHTEHHLAEDLIVKKTAGASLADVFASNTPKNPPIEARETSPSQEDAVSAQDEVVSDAELQKHPELVLNDDPYEVPASPLVEVANYAAKKGDVPLVLAPEEPVKGKRFVLTTDGAVLRVEPEIIEPIAIGEAIHVSLAAPINPNIFVRDASIVSWDPEAAKLIGMKAGETELYIVHAGNMSIVKLQVGGKAVPGNLKVPENLVAIDHSMFERERPLSSTPSLLVPKEPFRPALSITASAQQANETLKKARNQQAYYTYDQQDVTYQNLAIQVIDERSYPEAGIVYPVQGAEVRILGAEFSFVSDATGLVRFKDIPAGARLLVVVFDREGRIIPTIQEVQTQKELREDTQRVKVIQRSTYDVYSRSFQVTQNAGLASMCGRLVAPNGQARDFSGLRVLLSNEGEGGFYFNQYGPDPYGREMDASGQFCFFNVKPGITEVRIFEGNEMLAAFPVSLVSGTHLQDDFEVQNTPVLRTHLTVTASGLDQVYQDGERASRLSAVDDADILLVGENERMRNIGRTILEVPAGKTAYKNRLYGLVQGAEFETTLFPYQMDDASQLPITPLVPRGFVQDVFNELYQQDSSTSFAFDPSLGAMLVQFGHPFDISSRDVTIRVLSSSGQEVQSGWYFGAESGSQTKALYFNLDPGIYTVVVEDKNGQWLDVSTMPVDFWTLSVARLGAIMHYDPNKIAQDPDQ